ncbi:hypothetical protein E2562_037045 [Oryza meyeriana var. granulata]|uniref:Uncharacterized protein n=1 Tax=Oryza meyeriana var. granulata TaxID=110450 RepID=A0A6G1DU11_9ORYZ|nr:hypothetical protein E2562_037045 [Oryza meyeriana var. granulata]
MADHVLFACSWGGRPAWPSTPCSLSAATGAASTSATGRDGCRLQGVSRERWRCRMFKCSFQDGRLEVVERLPAQACWNDAAAASSIWRETGRVSSSTSLAFHCST